jgi:outer membrane usher protein FimD/PapC
MLPETGRRKCNLLTLTPLALTCQLGAAGAYAQSLPDVAPAPGTQEEVSPEADGFDIGVLQRRGIDPALANTLLKQPRFEAGTHRLALSVNGHERGRANVRFGSDGKPCFDQALLAAARLQLPAAMLRAAGDTTEACLPFLDAYPETQIEPDVAKLALSLVVPTPSLRTETRDTGDYSRGGTAGIVNYELSALRSRRNNGNGGSGYTSLNSALGFNAGDWIVRSRRVDTLGERRSAHSNLETYAQRSFIEQRLTLQIGDVNLANPVVAAARVRGVQLGTETALDADESGALVEGIAQSPARVEVSQNGQVIYATVVPSGPFSLKDLRPPSRQSDLEVSVIETDGREQRFVVPGIALVAAPASAGFSAGVGRIRRYGEQDTGDNWVASLGWTGRTGRLLNTSAGAVVSRGYRSAGTALNISLPRQGMALQGQLTGSHTVRHHRAGAQMQIAINQRLRDAWQARAAVSRQTRGYRTVLDTATRFGSIEADARYHYQYSAGLGWNGSRLGTLSANIAESTLFDGRRSRRWTASWGKSWRAASVNASLDWGRDSRGRQDNAAYVSVNLPLGAQRNARFYARERGGATRFGASYSERLSDTMAYRASAERSQGGEVSSMSLGATLLPRYTQLDLSYNRDGGGADSYTGLMRGGVVLHGKGITLAPYPIADTFALLQVGKQAGIKLNTPSGPVWTDAGGRAVAAQLTPYGNSTIDVTTQTLPRNVDLQNGSAPFKAARGAVESLRFDLVSARRVLFSANLPDGTPLPFGTAVSDDSGQLIGLAMAEGRIFVGQYQPGMRLWASPGDAPRCELDYELPDEPSDADAYYETATAVCRAAKD